MSARRLHCNREAAAHNLQWPQRFLEKVTHISKSRVGSAVTGGDNAITKSGNSSADDRLAVALIGRYINVCRWRSSIFWPDLNSSFTPSLHLLPTPPILGAFEAVVVG